MPRTNRALRCSWATPGSATMMAPGSLTGRTTSTGAGSRPPLSRFRARRLSCRAAFSPALSGTSTWGPGRASTPATLRQRAPRCTRVPAAEGSSAARSRARPARTAPMPSAPRPRARNAPPSWWRRHPRMKSQTARAMRGTSARTAGRARGARAGRTSRRPGLASLGAPRGGLTWCSRTASWGATQSGRSRGLRLARGRAPLAGTSAHPRTTREPPA
mmetsp:Transcript_64115/g.146934  ORF Transcript_64115/g.146934 Transcript_64115/m.146934 type:complete len:217 (+) Transcript_64115:287-937(+)